MCECVCAVVRSKAIESRKTTKARTEEGKRRGGESGRAGERVVFSFAKMYAHGIHGSGEGDGGSHTKTKAFDCQVKSINLGESQIQCDFQIDLRVFVNVHVCMFELLARSLAGSISYSAFTLTRTRSHSLPIHVPIFRSCLSLQGEQSIERQIIREVNEWSMVESGGEAMHDRDRARVS